MLALASGLAIQLTSSPPIASGFDLSKAPPHVVAHISGTAAMAIGLGQNAGAAGQLLPGQ